MLTERAVGVEVGGDREVGGAGQNLEKKKKRRERGKQYMGSLHKIRMLAPLCQLCKETLKVSHASHPPIITAPPPLFQVKFPILPLQPFLQNFIPPPL